MSGVCGTKARRLPGRRSLPSGKTARSPGHTWAAISLTGRRTTNCSARFAKETDMARGERPLPFEQMQPYMRGAKFAALALSRRHQDHDPDLADDAARYVDMAERYPHPASSTARATRDRADAQPLAHHV